MDNNINRVIKEHKSGKNWYDRLHKMLLIIPAILILFSFFYLFQFYQNTGDVFYKDVTLTGGTTISVFDVNADTATIANELKNEFPDLTIRIISDIRTGGQKGFFIETKEDVAKIKTALEKVLGYELKGDNSSVEFSGATLSSGFYSQLRGSLIAAFILMALVVFIIFGETKSIKAITLILSSLGVELALPGISSLRWLMLFFIISGAIYGFFKARAGSKDKLILGIVTIFSLLIFFFLSQQFVLIFIGFALIVFYTIYSVPSIAVILAAFADIVMTVATVDALGISLSSAGIIAFLMLIGYSVDTDILLTTRVLKNGEGSINSRVYGAFKTGMTMTLAAIASVGVSLILVYNFSETLRQIFTIVLIGLLFDILNTWVTNASIIKWFVEIKEQQR